MPPGCEALPWGDAQALERALAPADVAALVVEPIQGASVRELEPAYPKQALAACRRHGTVFVANEILTGLGRTGTFIACERAGVVPDVVLLAKGLSAGMMPSKYQPNQ